MTLPDWNILDLATAADANFVTHAGWVQQRLPGMQFKEESGLTLIDSGLPCDTFNFVCRARLTSDNAKDAVRQARTFFRSVRRPFSWWVGPVDQPPELGDLLIASGLERAENELAMAADLTTLHVDTFVQPGLEIKRVHTSVQLRDFARINAANWTPPDRLVLRFYELAESTLLANQSAIWLYVGYLNGIPVATAELTVGGGVVGLYNITTLKAFRRRGIGRALTLQPLLDAQMQGHQVAILQAAKDGIGIYKRIGFQEFGEITEYKPPD